MLSFFLQLLLLGIVFFLVITPVGRIRRLCGIDSLRLRQFKKGRRSVLTDRNHVYTPDDLKNIF